MTGRPLLQRVDGRLVVSRDPAPDQEEQLTEALKRAQASKKELEAATDKLDSHLKAVEKALTELRLGVRAHVHIGSDRLAFTKFSGAWRLVVEGAGEPQLLLSCSRHLRIDAAGMLADLVKRLCVVVEDETVLVERAITDIDELLPLLRGAQPDGESLPFKKLGDHK